MLQDMPRWCIKLMDLCTLDGIKRQMSAPILLNIMVQLRGEIGPLLIWSEACLKAKIFVSEFWLEGANIASYLLNRTPTKSQDSI